MKAWVIQSQHHPTGGETTWGEWSIFWYEDGGPHASWLCECEQSPSPIVIDVERATRNNHKGTQVRWARTLEDCIRILKAALSNRIQVVPFRFFNMITGEHMPTEFLGL